MDRSEPYLQRCMSGDYILFAREDGELGCETERMFRFTAICDTSVVMPITVYDMLRRPDFVVTVIPLRSPRYVQ